MDYKFERKSTPQHEGHECFINSLKQKTSRPSYLRTVQLADFMAFLDLTLRGVEQFVSESKVFAALKKQTTICLIESR